MLWSKRSCWPRLHVVHCGIEPESLTARQHQGRGRRLLFVGRFDYVKGLPLLLEAFATLTGRDPQLHLDLVGDGPERSDLEAMVDEMGLKERVTFHGYHSQEELRKDYARADLFVLTSFAEGIPVVLMEAMAQGVPVVAPRITGIPELVEDGGSGLLYTPGAVDQLMERVELLLVDAELRNRLAEAGRKTVALQFNQAIESARLAKIMVGSIRNEA
jgi:glycosyltransferase involved in cell wall biosynthesis